MHTDEISRMMSELREDVKAELIKLRRRIEEQSIQMSQQHTDMMFDLNQTLFDLNQMLVRR